MTEKEKIELGVQWFDTLDNQKKREAFLRLFEFAVEQEWIGVWDPEDREELAEDIGVSVEEYAVPYFTTCGESLVK
jgi:hypothetical protein